MGLERNLLNDMSFFNALQEKYFPKKRSLMEFFMWAAGES
jgi:hypothetical protein